MEETGKFYEAYFPMERRHTPYQSLEEVQKDICSLLDIYLIFLLKRKQEAPEKMNLKGVVITAEEVEYALNSNRIQNYNGQLSEQMQEELGEAISYIEARFARTKETKQEKGIRFFQLIESFALSKWESFVLLLTLAAAFERKYEKLFGFLQDDITAKLPTKGLILSLYECWDSITVREKADFIQGRGTLYYYFLTVQEGQASVLAEGLRAKPEIVVYLYGTERTIVPFEACVESYSYQEDIEPLWIHQTWKQKIEEYLQRAGEEEALPQVIQLYGEKGNGKKFLWRHIAKTRKQDLLVVDIEKLCQQELMQKDWLQSLFLEVLLYNKILCLCNIEETHWSKIAEAFQRLKEEIGEHSYYQNKNIVFVLLSETAGLQIPYWRTLSLFLPPLSLQEKLSVWQAVAQELPMDSQVDIRSLASRYSFTVAEIKNVLQEAYIVSLYEKESCIRLAHIISAAKKQKINAFGKYAALINASFSWEDFVTEEKQKRQLQMICNQLKYKSVVEEEWGFKQKMPYGRGICAVFYGPSGTGKTMAVQVMANELGLDLYRVDISQLVSKYIGETEKNITELFQRAQSANALLFFDEADSLFAKRSEVKDSHDRNANTETAHLLQTIEDYEGIVILATNYYHNMDDAFKRRMKFVIKFSNPTKELRYQLWNSILPKKVKQEEELDFAFFAEKFELTGSGIKEILNNAAYLAAAQQRGMANIHIVEAIKLHYEKVGKILLDNEFGYLIEH